MQNVRKNVFIISLLYNIKHSNKKQHFFCLFFVFFICFFKK
ncbi:hypothetical protein CU002_2494 [Enterococcus faecium]|nr:hypothetical protein [Enterococcus faecium]